MRDSEGTYTSDAKHTETADGKRAKILFVSVNFAPEMISTGLYATGTAEFMARNDMDVSVIAANPYYPAWKVFEGWPSYRYVAECPHEQLRVIHCPSYVPANPSGLKRILHFLSFNFTAFPVAVWRAWRDKPDLVFVVVPSMISAVVALMAARVAGARTWMHVQDFEVEAAFATGLLPKEGLIAKLARGFELKMLRRFDRVSSISEPMLAKLVAKGVPEPHTYEFRNWADLSRINPIEGPSSMRDELGISSRHVALYSGNLANKQGLEIIPQMARKLSHRSDLTIAVCGDGPMRQKLIELSEGLGNIRFFPLQPIEKLSELLGMADVHILPQIAGAADLVLPSKLANMLASGRPIVATAAEGTALWREVDGCGLNVSPNDSAGLAAALERLLDDDALRKRLGHAARARAIERWDGGEIRSRLMTELAKLIEAGSTNLPRKSQMI